MKQFTGFFLVLVFIFATISANATTPADEPKGTIKGILVDNDDTSPVIYANVVLYSKPDSIMTSWTITSDNGGFE